MSPSPTFVPTRRGAIAGPVASALLAAVALASCSGSADQSAPASAPAVSAPSAEIGSLPPSTAAPADTLGDAVLAQIVADAAALTGVNEVDVTVVSAKPVTWTDGSLGCPKPGVMYTQAIVSGFRVIVQAGDRRLDYRVGRSGQAKRCDSGMSVGSEG